MIAGAVTLAGDATIRLTIQGSGALSLELDVVIDTGYNGELTLPRAFIV
jgi:predicted aspartyl protease